MRNAMPRWVIGVGVVVVLAAGALVVRSAVTGDDAGGSSLTASVPSRETSSPPPFTCPSTRGFGAIRIPSPDEFAEGVNIAFPALDIRAALGGVPEDYLFDEPELELVAAAILCSISDEAADPTGARGPSGMTMALSGPSGRPASRFRVLRTAIVAQESGGPQGGYDPETERWEVSGSQQVSADSSKPDAEGARLGIDLQYTASAPKCWDDDGSVDAVSHISGKVSRLNSDGVLTTVEVDARLTLSISDGSVSSEFQVGALRYTERDGEATTDWDLPALLYDDNDFATLEAAQRAVAAYGGGTALATYAAALEKAYEANTLDRTSDCLEIVLDPSELVLAPGDSAGVTARVRDWKNRPIVVVVSAEAAQGAVNPEVGPSSGDGVWATTYTAPSAAYETDRVVFTAQRQAHVARGYLQVGIPGETWSFSMRADVEQVSFLWDGLFIVGVEGQVTGSGIGTVFGVGYCEVNDVTGPIAEITGNFTFEMTGTSGTDGGAEFLSLKVDSTEADIKFSYEDPMCGGFVEIARDFLKLVPTFSSFLPGIEIRVSNGFGIVNLPFDPYVFEVDIARLNE